MGFGLGLGPGQGLLGTRAKLEAHAAAAAHLVEIGIR